MHKKFFSFLKSKKMSKLNSRDSILYLIFKELQDEKTLFSYLRVNKTWCETIIPILWKDPWKYLKGKKFKKNLNRINNTNK